MDKTLNDLAGRELDCSSEIDRLKARLERLKARRAAALVEAFDAADLRPILGTTSELAAGMRHLRRELDKPEALAAVRAEANAIDDEQKVLQDRRRRSSKSKTTQSAE
jgi:hypothetical protein